MDSLHISFHNHNDYIFLLRPEEERYLDFQVDANATSHLYASVHGRRNGDKFHLDSPLLREEVLGNPAEIESILFQMVKLEENLRQRQPSKGCVIVRD